MAVPLYYDRIIGKNLDGVAVNEMYSGAGQRYIYDDMSFVLNPYTNAFFNTGEKIFRSWAVKCPIIFH